jgi:CBS domain-containing protein
MTVKDIMTPAPACCTLDTGLRDVAHMMVEHDCGEIPICDDGKRPIGVVTDRDIVCRLVAEGLNPLDHAARDCMSTPAITVAADAEVADASRLMEQYRIRRLPVVDAAGAICGIVSQADLAVKGPSAIAIEMVEKVSERTAAAGGTA